MNRRKANLTRSGKSSVVVVLPHDWILGNDLKPGDSVDVLYDGDVHIRKPDAPKASE